MRLTSVVMIVMMVLLLAANVDGRVEIGGKPTNKAGQKVTRSSWGERLGASFVGMLLGFGMFFFTFVVLMANEGVYVARMKTLEKVKADYYSKDDGKRKPFYETDIIQDVPLEDKTFSVKQNCLKLRRVAEMYQYQEESESTTEKDTIGGGTTTVTKYRLTCVWSEYRIDLPGNAEETPVGGNPDFPVRSGEVVNSRTFSKPVHFGEHGELSKEQVEYLGPWVPAVGIETIEIKYGGEECNDRGLKVGDVRVRWVAVYGGEFTVLCGRDGKGLGGYVVEGVGKYHLPSLCYPCACCGFGAVLVDLLSSHVNVIDTVQRGHHSFDALLSTLTGTAYSTLVLLRLLGFFLFTFSILLILAPIPTLLDVIGPLGTIASYSTVLLSLLLASLLTPITIAFCWASYRPHIALAILLIPAVIWYLTLHLTPPNANLKFA